MDPESIMDQDVKDLAQKIADETAALVASVETLDANTWLSHADKLDALNSQLQALIIPEPTPTTKKTNS